MLQQQQAGSSTTRLLQLLQDRSGIDEARPMLEAELAQREAKLGPKHADTLLSCTCLAMLLQAKGELAAAPLLQRLIHATGLDYDAHGRSEDGTFFAPEPRAQAYGAYWALLAPVWKSPCSMAWPRT